MAKQRRKLFPCGHVGAGTYCHRCAQDAERRQAEQAQRAGERQQEQAWQQTFNDDPIDLRVLPNRSLVERARYILAAIRNGEGYQRFRGKCMTSNKEIVSVPLGYSYRLLFRRTPQGFQPLQCDSHETYNKRHYA